MCETGRKVLTRPLLVPLPFPSWLPFPLFFLRLQTKWFASIYRGLLHPPVFPVQGVLVDLTLTKAERIAENALLRHLLVILHRHVKRPLLHWREQFGLLPTLRRVRNWRDVLLSIPPETFLRWHRIGFCLFWK